MNMWPRKNRGEAGDVLVQRSLESTPAEVETEKQSDFPTEAQSKSGTGSTSCL